MINIITIPSILTDAIFVDYNGQTGTSSSAQRQATYAIAEGKAVEEIGTFVSPTLVTGTYSWPPMNQSLQLEHTHVSMIHAVTAIHDAGCDCADDSIELSGCAWLLDADGGLVSLRECGDTLRASCSGCGCSHPGHGPLQARIVYTAGLPTGAAFDPRLLIGLVTWADLALQQMIDPAGAEGGPGDPGVQRYSSIGYNEERTALLRTAMGSSARANYGANMLRVFKFKRAMKLGW